MGFIQGGQLSWDNYNLWVLPGRPSCVSHHSCKPEAPLGQSWGDYKKIRAFGYVVFPSRWQSSWNVKRLELLDSFSLQVTVLVEYLPATASMPPAFSPCPEPPPQQLQQQLRVELEERREALPVVWPTNGEQSAPLEMLPGGGLKGGASSLTATPSCLLCLVFLMSSQ